MTNIINIDKDLKLIFVNTFNVKKTEINESSSMKNITNWDSLNHIGLITSIEEKFGFSFNENEIPQMINYKKIKNKILKNI